MTPDATPPAVCLFCNESIPESDESVRLTVAAAWTAATGAYWCHGRCLENATHPAIPLYILSLHRDEAVYGRRPL